MTAVFLVQVAAVAEGNATVTERATDEARSHAPSFIFFDMKFPFERGAHDTWGALQVGEKVLVGHLHLKGKMAKLGNALRKISRDFYSFLQFLHVYPGVIGHKAELMETPGVSSRVIPRGGNTVRLMLRMPSAVNSSIEDLSTTTFRWILLSIGS